MADSKELVPSDSTWSPEFINELLPSAQRVALLYHLSYLCLGKFPKLERILRERAVETQLLFGSSEALLFKCMGTSSNLVSSLFPMLILAVEKNKPTLAVKFLEKARSWINDIIRDVDDMVKRYDEQNRKVASCTSDVITEKTETEKQLTQQSEIIKNLETFVANFEKKLRENEVSLQEIDRKIDEKNTELQNHIRDSSKTSRGLGILAALVPFIGPIIKSIHDSATAPGVAAKTQALSAEISRLTSEKTSLKNLDWKISVQLTEQQLKLATSKIELGAIPDPVHLKDVQKHLSRIQKILIQLKGFWEKVGSLLDTLGEKTFVGENLIDLEDLKEDFIKSIEIATECWATFGRSCQRAQGMFSIESRDAYKFLETDPSSLSPDQWDEQYKCIMDKLNNISPETPHVQEPNTAAITE